MNIFKHHLRTASTALRVLALPLALFGLLAACSDPSTSKTDASSPSATPLIGNAATNTGETLLLQPPPSWLRVTEQSSDAFRLAEFVPAGQDKDDWLDKLFIESNSLTPLPDPIAFLNAMGGEIKTECNGPSDVNVSSGIENGYETSVRLLLCKENRNSARAEVKLIKAIKGNDNFYVISRAKRSVPLENETSPITDREMGEWSLYMRSIKLCDTRNPDHPCPKTR